MIKEHVFLNILLVVVGFFVYLTYEAFLLDIAVASLMAIALASLEMFFFKKFHKNRYLSSSAVTLLFAITLFAPMLYFIFEVAAYVQTISFDSIKEVLEKTKELTVYLPEIIKSKVESYLTVENIQSSYDHFILFAGGITASSANFIKDMLLIIVFFFFANLYGRQMLGFLQSVIPLDYAKARTLFFQMSNVMSLVFYSVLITALLEGFLFGIIAYIFDFNPLFFMIIYAFASLIPIIGGSVVWVPLGLYLYTNGETTAAIAIGIYSVVVISLIADTFVKPLIIELLKKELNNSVELNSMLIFFSILAGLSAFGFWGVIIGPAVTTLFLSILSFYKKMN